MLNVITVPPIEDKAKTQEFLATLSSGIQSFSSEGFHKTARGKTELYQALLKMPKPQKCWRDSWMRQLLIQDPNNRLPRGFKPATFGFLMEDPVEIPCSRPVPSRTR